jgi:hypothetical protein
MTGIRLRVPTFRRGRVTAIRCSLCRQWRKPRHIRIPASVCCDCETTPTFQAWKPTIQTAESVPVPAGGHV